MTSTEFIHKLEGFLEGKETLTKDEVQVVRKWLKEARPVRDTEPVTVPVPYPQPWTPPRWWEPIICENTTSISDRACQLQPI